MTRDRSNIVRESYRNNYASAYYRPRRGRLGIGMWITIGLVFFLIVGVVWFSAYQASERTLDTVVTGKERVCETTSDGSDCKYLVFTDDGTFKVTDGYTGSGGIRFSSSDLYGQIEEGPATLTVIGWRVPIFSSYPNIVEVDQ